MRRESLVASQTPGWPGGTLLGSLRESVRDEFLTIGVLRVFPPRRQVIRQWDESQHSFLLIRGIVKVVGSANPGTEALLDIRVGGDLVGEMSALDGERRSASVLTCGEVQARLIKQAELASFMTRYPEVAIEIGRIMARRLRWANRRRLDFLAHDATTRVGRLLVELTDTYGRRGSGGWDLGLDLTQAELASVAGVAKATAEKALHSLEQDALIKRGYRRIVVTDLELMRAAVGLTEPPPRMD
jgi:CRP/FNR family transcriptional regulator, cyclic AMP receptor protein